MLEQILRCFPAHTHPLTLVSDPDGLLAELPAEALLYWFTLCFYGNRLSAGRAALRALLTYEEPPPPRRPARRKGASRPNRPAADPAAPALPGVGDL